MKSDRLRMASQYVTDESIPAPVRLLLAELIREVSPPRAPDTADRIAAFWAKVDKSNDCWLWTASVQNKGYGQYFVYGRNRYAHRIAYELTHGPIPDGMAIDHLCHVRRCVRPEHLRAVTPKQNNENFPSLRGRGVSGIRGVSWNKADCVWEGYVRHNNRNISIGRFEDLEVAAREVQAARLLLHTHNDLDRIGG